VIPDQTQALTSGIGGLMREMLEEKIPVRRNRINPRVIKRKMSRWNKKRPHHRKQPPLSKTFEESVVMQT
jgi:hypothetical protein